MSSGDLALTDAEIERLITALTRKMGQDQVAGQLIDMRGIVTTVIIDTLLVVDGAVSLDDVDPR